MIPPWLQNDLSGSSRRDTIPPATPGDGHHVGTEELPCICLTGHLAAGNGLSEAGQGATGGGGGLVTALMLLPEQLPSLRLGFPAADTVTSRIRLGVRNPGTALNYEGATHLDGHVRWGPNNWVWVREGLSFSLN